MVKMKKNKLDLEKMIHSLLLAQLMTITKSLQQAQLMKYIKADAMFII